MNTGTIHTKGDFCIPPSVSFIPQPHPVTQGVRNLDGAGAGWGPEEAAGSHREAITLGQGLSCVVIWERGLPN